MIYYKFKSQKDPSRIVFDGPSISVFDLKREIMLIKKLGNGTEFDLAIYNEESMESGSDASGKIDPIEYTDDEEMIPRATSIIAVRRPPCKQGKGTAAKYVSDLNIIPTRARRLEFPKKNEVKVAKKSHPPSTPAIPGLAKEQADDHDDTAAIAKMMSAQSANWDSTQEEMALVTPVYNNRPKKAPAAVPDKPLPTGYVCHRCVIPGHWIQACPTLSDPNFDTKRQLKRTTGIPQTFLKKTDKSIFDSDDVAKAIGLMLNANGEYVVVEPDNKSWAIYQAKQKASSEADISSRSKTRQHWDCQICGKWPKKADRTPCCKRLYCHWCIENSLIESDFVCPGCEAKDILLDSLVEDEEIRNEISEYWKSRDAKRKSVSPTPEEMQNVSSLGKKKMHLDSEETAPSPKRSRSGTPGIEALKSPNNNRSQQRSQQTSNSIPPFGFGILPMPSLPFPDPFMMAALGMSMPEGVIQFMPPTGPRNNTAKYTQKGNVKFNGRNNGYTRRSNVPEMIMEAQGLTGTS